jgi:hypothetical protein
MESNANADRIAFEGEKRLTHILLKHMARQNECLSCYSKAMARFFGKKSKYLVVNKEIARIFGSGPKCSSQLI